MGPKPDDFHDHPSRNYLVDQSMPDINPARVCTFQVCHKSHEWRWICKWIPTVLDRVIQQAVAQVLGPLFEADFSEHSHGLPPLHSGHASLGFAIQGCRYRGGRIPSRPLRPSSGDRDGGKLERRPPPRRGMRPQIVLSTDGRRLAMKSDIAASIRAVSNSVKGIMQANDFAKEELENTRGFRPGRSG